MSNPARSTTCKRRLRFQLRTLIVLCVALGAVGGLVASQVITVANVYRNVKRLEQQGVLVTSDFYDRYGLFPWQRSGTWRSVLEWSLACPDDVNVAFVRPSEIHELMERVATMPTVRRLNLAAINVSSEDVQHLKKMSRLEDLYLTATAIDDSAMDSLTALPHLRMLDLSGTSISDAALPQIAGIVSLVSVNLLETSVSRRGVRDLRRARPDLVVSRPPKLRKSCGHWPSTL